MEVVQQECFRDRDDLEFFMVRRGAAVDIVGAGRGSKNDHHGHAAGALSPAR